MTRPPLTSQSEPAPFIKPDERLATIALDVAARDWGLAPDFLDAATLAGLREDAMARRDTGRFRAAGVGRASGVAIRPELRSDQLSWIEPGEPAAAVNAYLLAMEGLRRAMNRHLYLGLMTLESQFSVYPPGAFYRRHLDRHRDSDERILSCVLYLNEDWRPSDGGQLRLYPAPESTDGETVDVLPEAGLLVTFLSDRVPHEVLPTKRERLSIASWFRGRPRGA